MRDSGYPASVVRAVLAHNAHNPFVAQNTAGALANATQLPSWEQLLDAYARCVRITRKETETYTVDPSAFVEDAERALYTDYQEAATKTDGTVEAFVEQVRYLEPAINDFFDSVLVMVDDVAVRQNRLGLLQAIAALTDGIADLSELEGF